MGLLLPDSLARVLFMGRFKSTSTYCGPSRFTPFLYITLPIAATAECYVDRNPVIHVLIWVNLIFVTYLYWRPKHIVWIRRIKSWWIAWYQRTRRCICGTRLWRYPFFKPI